MGLFGMSTKQTIIAIVEDDPAVREALNTLLSSFGYIAELYASAEEFLNAAATSAAKCLVVDIQLGDITGVEMGRQLFASGFTFPIVFMTGSPDVTFWRHAMELGCVAYLQKPFDADRLSEAIVAAIGEIPHNE